MSGHADATRTPASEDVLDKEIAGRFAPRHPIGIQQAKEQGWPEQPKVTTAEELLYAESAPMIRVLGNAVAEAERSYSIACMLRDEFPSHDDLPERPFGNEKQVEALNQNILDLHEACARLRAAYRAAAIRAMDQFADGPIVKGTSTALADAGMSAQVEVRGSGTGVGSTA